MAKMKEPDTEQKATEFTIDNNILSDILNWDVRTDELIRHLKKANARIVIPSEVSLECFSGKAEELVKGRVKRLNKIYTETNGKLHFSHLVQDMMHLEVRARGSLRDTYLISETQIRNSSLFNPKYFDRLHPNLVKQAEAMLAKRLNREAADRKFREKAPSQFPQKEIVREIHAYEKNVLGSFQIILEHELEEFITWRKFAKNMNADGYLVTSAYAHYAILRIFLVALAEPDCVLSGLIAIDKNIWVDGGIAATAAYSDYLATKDKNLFRITNFLADKDAIRFRAIGEKEFYEKLAELSQLTV